MKVKYGVRTSDYSARVTVRDRPDGKTFPDSEPTPENVGATMEAVKNYVYGIVNLPKPESSAEARREYPTYSPFISNSRFGGTPAPEQLEGLQSRVPDWAAPLMPWLLSLMILAVIHLLVIKGIVGEMIRGALRTRGTSDEGPGDYQDPPQGDEVTGDRIGVGPPQLAESEMAQEILGLREYDPALTPGARERRSLVDPLGVLDFDEGDQARCESLRFIYRSVDTELEHQPAPSRLISGWAQLADPVRTELAETYFTRCATQIQEIAEMVNTILTQEGECTTLARLNLFCLLFGNYRRGLEKMFQEFESLQACYLSLEINYPRGIDVQARIAYRMGQKVISLLDKLGDLNPVGQVDFRKFQESKSGGISSRSGPAEPEKTTVEKSTVRQKEDDELLRMREAVKRAEEAVKAATEQARLAEISAKSASTRATAAEQIASEAETKAKEANVRAAQADERARQTEVDATKALADADGSYRQALKDAQLAKEQAEARKLQAEAEAKAAQAAVSKAEAQRLQAEQEAEAARRAAAEKTRETNAADRTFTSSTPMPSTVRRNISFGANVVHNIPAFDDSHNSGASEDPFTQPDNVGQMSREEKILYAHPDGNIYHGHRPERRQAPGISRLEATIRRTEDPNLSYPDLFHANTPGAGYFSFGNRDHPTPAELREAYRNLPEGWNHLPYIPVDRNTETHFLKGFENGYKFDGDLQNFRAWESMFINTVHLVESSERNKLKALMNAIETTKGKNASELRALFANIDYSPACYFTLVCLLVKEYGGRERQTVAAYRALRSLKKIDIKSKKSIREFSNILHNYTVAECKVNNERSLESKQLFDVIFELFSLDDARQYVEYIGRTGQDRGLKSFILWISDLEKQLDDMQFVKETYKLMENSKTVASIQAEDDDDVCYEDIASLSVITAAGASTDQVDKQGKYPPCDLCDKKHELSYCPVFRKWSSKEKWDHLLKSKKCLNCLVKGHTSSKCRSKRFGCKECDSKYHNTVIHSEFVAWKKTLKNKAGRKTLAAVGISQESADEDSDPEEYVVERNIESPVTVATTIALANIDDGVVSLMVCGVKLLNPKTGMLIMINMMIDSGSSGIFLSRWAAEQVQLMITESRMSLNTVGRKTEWQTCSTGEIKLQAIATDFACNVPAVVMDQLIGDIDVIDWNEYKHDFDHLKDIEFAPIVNERPRQIDLIVGVNYPLFFQTFKEIVDPGSDPKAPSARLGVFGWTGFGPVTRGETRGNPTLAFINTPKCDLLVHAETAELRTDSVFSPVGWPIAQTKTDKTEDFCAKVLAFANTKKGVKSITDKCQDDDCCGTLLNQILRLLEEQWKTEKSTPAEKEEWSADQHRAHEKLLKSRRMVDGKWEISVLWKDGEPNVANNRPRAISHLQWLLKGPLKDKAVRDLYNKAIQKWVDEGILVEVRLTSGNEPGVRFANHFPVVKLNRETTKVRPVLNFAEKFQGKSLNDCVSAGPNQFCDIRKVLIRARKFPIFLSMDISAMFLQIRMPECDQALHSLLWKPEEDSEIREFRFTRHTFGNRGSPAVAVFCIKQMAKELEKKYPRAAESVLNSTIMDDTVDSFKTVEEAVLVMRDLEKIFKECGMECGKYCTNSLEVLGKIPEEKRTQVLKVSAVSEVETENQVKTLGIRMDCVKDQIFFKPLEIKETTWTKLTVLKTYARLFDPLGLMIPYTIIAKAIFQSLWIHSKEWGLELQEDQLDKWLNWLKCMPDLKEIRIPRCVIDHFEDDLEQSLHVFCDASEIAYGYCLYVRTKYRDGTVLVRLVQANARVAPMKAQSIPRLELMGASLALEVLNLANDVYQMEPTQIHWYSDSATSLAWIRSQSRMLKTFVGNRVSKIQQGTLLMNWHHVPTDQNPADLCSRGLMPKELSESDLWWQGPEFLRTGEITFPELPENVLSDSAKSEFKKSSESAFVPTACMFSFYANLRKIRDEYVPTPEEETFQLHPRFFTDLQSLLNATAYWQRYMDNLQSGARKTPDGKVRMFKVDMTKYRTSESTVSTKTLAKLPPISKEEREKALTFHLKWHQKESFAKSLSWLEKSGFLSTDNPLLGAKPVIDGDGLMRVSSRMTGNLVMPLKATHPIIVDVKHPLATLLIWDVHQRYLLHGGGHGTCMGALSHRYFLPRGKNFVKNLLRQCLTCQRLNARSMVQVMSPLPDFRVQEGSTRLVPFATTCMDIFGHFWTKQGQRQPRQKRWVLLFVCAQYRCVSLELVTEMTAAAVTNAINIFLARRPTPRRFVTDNGKNFFGLSNALNREYGNLERWKLKRAFPDIKWHFIPKSASHMAGVHERMVQSSKRAMYKVITPGRLDDEGLRAAMASAEMSLNNRPISYISTSASDLGPLTPNHFLTGGEASELGPFAKRGHSFADDYQQLEQVKDELWKEFLRDVIPQMRLRPKWKREKPDLQVDDVVVWLNPDAKRHEFPLGRVTDIDVSKDGHVRVATIRHSYKMETVPITQLSVIKLPEKPQGVSFNVTPDRRQQDSVLQTGNDTSLPAGPDPVDEISPSRTKTKGETHSQERGANDDACEALGEISMERTKTDESLLGGENSLTLTQKGDKNRRVHFNDAPLSSLRNNVSGIEKGAELEAGNGKEEETPVPARQNSPGPRENSPVPARRRGPGRPKGSKNKAKEAPTGPPRRSNRLKDQAVLQGGKEKG